VKDDFSTVRTFHYSGGEGLQRGLWVPISNGLYCGRMCESMQCHCTMWNKCKLQSSGYTASKNHDLWMLTRLSRKCCSSL